MSVMWGPTAMEHPLGSSASMCHWTWWESVQIDLRGWPQLQHHPQENSLEVRVCWKQGRSKLLCTVISVFCGEDELKAETCSCNISSIFIMPKDKRSKLGWQIRRQLDLGSDLPEHMGSIFPISAQSELRIAFMGKEPTFTEWPPCLGTDFPQPHHQDFGHCDPIFMGLKKEKGTWQSLVNPPTSPQRGIPGWNANPVCLAWSPRVV